MSEETNLNTKSKGYYSFARQDMAPFLPDKIIKTVDIGCGVGNYGAYIKQKYNAEVWGIEVQPFVKETAEKNLDKILIGDANKMAETLPNKYFDLITCNDVLEHLIDPYSLLRILREKLTDDGCIVASIPNVRYFHTLTMLFNKRDWKYDFSGVLDNTHVRFFTEKSIRRMFEEAGYKIEILKGINPTDKFKAKLFNILTLGLMSDVMYIQFAVVARKTDSISGK